METTQSWRRAESGGGGKWFRWIQGWSCAGEASCSCCCCCSWEPVARQKALSDLRGAMSRFLNVLRSWLVMVSIIAMGNTLQSFRDHTFLYEKLYTGKPDLVNGLQARTFGIWTLLSSVIRCLCAIDIHNKMFLNPGNAGGAPVPRSRTRIQTEEEKLRPTSPRPRLRLPPLLASSFTLFALKFLFCSIIHF
ncbi:ergosterol biosynthetic protein 28 homolog isoform X3 [Eubalaena glacialis]|uniref:ergosterol biosynthetic protein 28 homolog isoform X3 n=1 Tax=Eubalaena glacialis TaxID=27606 RepID=UPI002A5A5452|nr:ergosterol biosynthetic protein 28 homolog isoform X3 [Eubalaena glacialis]